MATLTNIAVMPAASSVQTGVAQQLYATGVYDDGTYGDLTSAADWTSADPSIASISQAGVTTGLAAGATTISALYLGVTGSAALQVTAAPVVSPPCALLQKALTQMGLLMSGKGVVAIETPQLGRVEFTQGNIGDLQRYIDQLAGQCVASGGALPPGYVYRRRRPLSIEACP